MQRCELSEVFDVAVLGSGFAGSLMAMILRRMGRSVVLLERGTHPRFAMGESSTPLANLLLEELAERYGLDGVRPFAKWGTWQQHAPEVACGLKRGFSFFFDGAESLRDALLVAASPHDTVADTHWFRAEFDARLVEEARRLGAEYLDRVALAQWRELESCVELSGTRAGDPLAVRARFVVDASGPHGALSQLLGLRERELPMPQAEALYAHFEGVSRLAGAEPDAPYRADDAAVHHLFEGGWAWVLHFNNGLTSAGLVAEEPCARELGLAEGEPAWRRLLDRLPGLAKHFERARAVRPFTHAPQVRFMAERMHGPRWAMLPSAAGFVDPMFSTGFALTLLGVERLAAVLGRDEGQPAQLAHELDLYAAHTQRELMAVFDLVSATYAVLARPVLFQSVSLVYFAAASYAESARRLGRPERARGFLLCDEPEFWQSVQPLLARARAGIAPAEEQGFVRDVRQAIEPWDVAGLTSTREPAWYPVDAEDLRAGAHKVGASVQQVDAMLERSGFFATVR